MDEAKELKVFARKNASQVKFKTFEIQEGQTLKDVVTEQACGLIGVEIGDGLSFFPIISAPDNDDLSFEQIKFLFPEQKDLEKTRLIVLELPDPGLISWIFEFLITLIESILFLA